MEVVVVRHGETEWNREHREMGHLDSPLTPRGIEQAHALARRLCNMQIAAVYSSDLGRAAKTAEIIGAACGLPLTLRDDLRERNMGIFQGLTRDEMKERYPVEYDRYRHIGYTYRIPDGESAKDRRERSVRAMNSIAADHEQDDGVIAVVTHGGFLMGFFEHVLEIEPGNGHRFKRHNAACNVFQYEAGVWSLVTWNDISHMDGLEVLDDPTMQTLASERAS